MNAKRIGRHATDFGSLHRCRYTQVLKCHFSYFFVKSSGTIFSRRALPQNSELWLIAVLLLTLPSFRDYPQLGSILMQEAAKDPSFAPVLSADEIRRTHLSHEASVQSVGSLYYFAAAVSPIAGLSPILRGVPSERQHWIALGLFLILALVYFQLGRWFRSLNPKGRLPGTILSIIGLLAFPIGTLINAYILYLIHSARGRMVFSPEYRAVIEATPHIQYRLSKVAWVAIGLLILFFAAGLIAILLRPSS